MRDVGFKKKKLIICGDSFSYGVEEKTWPHIVSKHLDLELINLAIVGCGNYAICYQINHAVEIVTKDDLIVISLSAAERFEIDDDEFSYPASLFDFKQTIDEIKTSYSSIAPTITSGNLNSLEKNYKNKLSKKYMVGGSFRLHAQYQAWSLQHLIKQLPCKYLVYRNIYPRYHIDLNNYSIEHYFGLESIIINSGPYDYEKEYVNSTNHLSDEGNYLFAKRVLKDINDK